MEIRIWIICQYKVQLHAHYRMFHIAVQLMHDDQSMTKFSDRKKFYENNLKFQNNVKI